MKGRQRNTELQVINRVQEGWRQTRYSIHYILVGDELRDLAQIQRLLLLETVQKICCTYTTTRIEYCSVHSVAHTEPG
jgi:hypothetical protein